MEAWTHGPSDLFRFQEIITYDTRIRFVSEVIFECCSKLSPHNSKGVRFLSFHGQTRNVAEGQPRSEKKIKNLK